MHVQRHVVIDLDHEVDTFVSSRGPMDSVDSRNQGAQGEIDRLQAKIASISTPELEELINHALESVCLGQDGLGLPTLTVSEVAFRQQFGESGNDVERIAGS